MASTGSVIAKCFFEHIKSGGPCPFNDHLISQVEFGSRVNITQDNISTLLVQILDDWHGTEEIVTNRRKVNTSYDYMANGDLRNVLKGGSRGDGFSTNGSDTDIMVIQTNVVVTYPDQIHIIPRHNLNNKTILLMREADSRPGYVSLELSQISYGVERAALFQNAIVPVRDLMFMSSDIYRQGIVNIMNVYTAVQFVSNGPCTTSTDGYHGSLDFAFALPCVCWPRDANEWTHRTRLHGWPTQTMIDRIVQDGCHLVPVGDKCSADTLLQWRISFACAEQVLVHSLTHPQFRVYGLLKYFLTQIKDSLEHIIGDSDILCSYFLKTLIFYAVENSSSSIWQETHTFLCFRFCLSILIAWVKSGYCPNYFIRKNNMFLRKVHGEKRQQLLHFLIDLYKLKWMCLSVESDNKPYLSSIIQQQHSPESRALRECLRDLHLFKECYEVHGNYIRNGHLSLKCLNVAHSDVDEFIAYRAMVGTLYTKACDLFNEYNTARSNKQKYIALKKCKQLLTPQASLCTSPGLLVLATFYYLTGDYRQTLQMCADVMSSFTLFLGKGVSLTERYCGRYQQQYCGNGNTYRHKFRGVYFCVDFGADNIILCPPHLHLEITSQCWNVRIPPLPYATFLSFLCYHELGDLRRRDTALINLRAANYDPEQGGHRYWIVHTLLGICYQTVGDNRRAIRSFTDSMRVKPELNPAIDRINDLRRSQ